MRSPGEKEIREEIDSWLNEEPGLLANLGDSLSRPLAGLMRRVVPDSLRERLTSAFESALLKVGDASQFTFTVRSILEPFHQQGYTVQTLAEIKALPIEVTDAIAQNYIRSNRMISALEGGGLGLGGAAMIAADIPALMTINFRMISQIANSFGYNTLTGKDRIFLLQILSMAGAEAGDGRKKALAGLQETARSRDEELQLEGGKPGHLTMVKLAQELAEKLAVRLAHRKLGQLIPLVGAGIGAGMNYHFTQENGRAALVAYRQRRLDDERGPVLLTGPDLPPEGTML